ncbi:Uncharacterized protein PECH_005406 [Penicillium ucsense]|uniref:Defective in cullin neddylation protein n=1 Tax=Penicillium ucsense TaxID=2839758 RepID=A0A8J8WJY9_9EURO|nr:Uncharacterized protein PECM_005945 [Penicillium ucsense]KAF7736308.1 Uncharacterized protein PECH_005406 [Penicillium ucsense]
MPPATASQKQSIAQFVALTDCTDSVASKFLRAAHWNIDRAIDSYFSSRSSSNAEDKSSAALKKIFNQYRDESNEEAAVISIEGAMRFLEDINVQLDEVTCLGVMELCKCPTMGEFPRESFVAGWKEAKCDTLPKMAEYANQLRSRIPTDKDLFRRVYCHTFPISRMAGQRNLPYDLAAEQWRLLFTADRGGVPWSTASTPWLEWWLEFLEERGKKAVSKDLWQQLELFVRKTKEDESFGWWSVDAAWPGTLDDFVGWVQEKRAQGSAMEL